MTATKPARSDKDRSKSVQDQRLWRDRQTDRDIGTWFSPVTKKWEFWEPTYSQESQRRRAPCQRNLLKYLQTYHSASFPIAFSPYHFDLIRQTQEAILEGGQQVIVAMPRGSGKTTILTFSVMWAALCGHSRYSVLVAGDDPKAKTLLKKIRVELESNLLLREDFPEVIIPIVKLDRSPTRAHYQLFMGKSTHLEFGSHRVVLPTLPHSSDRGNAGNVMSVGGIESAIRGANYTDPRDGSTIRPDLVLVDDPQTRRSAKSGVNCDERESILCSDITMMAGPTTKLSVFVAATVIYPGDVVDRLLDPTRHPEWTRIRVKMLTSMPDNTEMWDRYAELRRLSLVEGRGGSDATEYYRANRDAMDAGAVAYWPERFAKPYTSAIEHAMVMYIDNPQGFASECQNEPLDPEAPEDASIVVTEDDIVQMIAGHPAEKVPARSDKLVAMVDVSERCLWWVVCGVSSRFEIDVIAYGTWPGQKMEYITLSTIQQTLVSHYGLASRDAIRSGVQDIIGVLMETRWENTAGDAMRIEMACVDSKWGPMNRVVKEAVWESPWAGVWFPSEGHGIGASSRPLNDTEKARKAGEIRGQHWRKTRDKDGARGIYDTNHWKTFAAMRIKDRCVSVHAGSVRRHQAFIEQMTSEYPVRVESRIRTVDEWKQRNLRPDNHWWDCFVGCCVCASMSGVSIHGHVKVEGGPKKPLRLSELRRRTDAR